MFNVILEDGRNIKELLNSDISLRNINCVEGMSPLGSISYDISSVNMNKPSDVTVYAFKRILMWMVYNGRTEESISIPFRFKNEREMEQKSQDMVKIIEKAYKDVLAYNIDVMSPVKGVVQKIDTTYTKDGYGVVKGKLNIHIQLNLHYLGALGENTMFLYKCDEIIRQLYRYGKLSDYMSEKEKMRVLYNWVVLHTEYDNSYNSKSFTGAGALFEGVAVCQGMTALYNALCKRLGISVYGVMGVSSDALQRKNPEKHIWTVANVGNRRVFIDVTYGNPTLDKGSLMKAGIDPANICDFKWFDLNYTQFHKNRVLEKG